MQVILVHPRLKRAHTLTITRRKVLATALASLVVVGLSTGLLSYVTVKTAIDSGLPFVAERIKSVTAAASVDKDRVAKANIDALAVKLGQMQAQLTRLDALGDRVAGMTGVKIQDLNSGKIPGRGGVEDTSSRTLKVSELEAEIALVSARIDQRTDHLQQVESEWVSRTVRTKLLPNSMPLPDSFMGSAFGTRIDPITGRAARHDGIDFSAPPGSPIHSAAGGVVVAAEFHPGYGNMLDVDHGNNLVTRYAHAQRLLVKQGDIVKQGQIIAEVGSTGRSTGPHLHFEVRIEGEAIDPRRYLDAGLGFVQQVAKQSKQ